MPNLEIDVVESMVNFTITVKLQRSNELALRMKLGLFLWKLGARIMNVNIEIEDVLNG